MVTETPARAAGGGDAGRVRRRRRALALLASLFLLPAVVGAFALGAAWTRTARREAYLPDLEAQARRSPHDPALLALLGGRLAEAAEYGASERTLQMAAGDGAQAAPVWLTWAACDAALGRPVRAGAVLRLGRQRPEAAPAVQAALDRCRLLGATPPPAALARAICPDAAAPLVDAYSAGSFLDPLAEAWGRRHPAQSGFETRRRWARERPGDIGAQLLWVDALMRNRRPAEAERVARGAARAAPADAEAHRALADVLFRGGAFVKAGLEYKECLRLRPDWLPAEIGLGRVAVEKKLIPLAVQTFERATRQDPSSTDAWVGLGRAYLNQRLRSDKSLAAFQTAARLSPARTDYFPYYSDALVLTYHPDQAEALLRRRLAEADADARSHYLLALVLLNNSPTPGRQAEAEAHLRASLRLEPDAPPVKVRLAQVLLDRGQYQEAERLLVGGLRGDPDSPLAMSLLARTLLGLGRPADAEAVQQKAAQLSLYTQAVAELQAKEDADPADSALHERLALLYRSGGQQEQAGREAQMASLLRAHKEAASRGLTDLNAATGAYMPVPDRSAPVRAAPENSPR